MSIHHLQRDLFRKSAVLCSADVTEKLQVVMYAVSCRLKINDRRKHAERFYVA